MPPNAYGMKLASVFAVRCTINNRQEGFQHSNMAGFNESFHCIYTIWYTQVHAHLYEHSHTHTVTITTYKHIQKHTSISKHMKANKAENAVRQWRSKSWKGIQVIQQTINIVYCLSANSDFEFCKICTILSIHTYQFWKIFILFLFLILYIDTLQYIY